MLRLQINYRGGWTESDRRAALFRFGCVKYNMWWDGQDRLLGVERCVGYLLLRS